MTSRDEILARVRKNQPAAQPLPSLPAFERQTKAPLATFKANLLRMGGKFVELPAIWRYRSDCSSTCFRRRK